jgi:tetratricopeptide (TPR) repeat protein
LNPASKDLSKQSDALQCAQAVTESKRAFQHSNWPLAKDYLDQALRFAEAAPSLLMDRSWCWFHLGEQYDTIADTGKVLKLEADNMEALELRGRAYYIIGELETAINHYRKALHLDPEHKACKDMYRVVKSVIDNQKKADKATSSGDHKRAAEILIKLIAVDPDHRTVIPKARLDLARAYRHLKQLKEARQEAELVIKADENNAEAYKILGLLLGDLEDFEGAVQKLNKAKELSQGADREIDDELRKAEAALKQSKQKDYYKTLKVSHTPRILRLSVSGYPQRNVVAALKCIHFFSQFVCVFYILTKYCEHRCYQ